MAKNISPSVKHRNAADPVIHLYYKEGRLVSNCENIGGANFDVEIVFNPKDPIVTVNGVRYSQNGAVREVIRVARVKYTEEHFNKVDELINGGYKECAACRMVANENDFPEESFYRQYRGRHFYNRSMAQHHGK